MNRDDTELLCGNSAKTAGGSGPSKNCAPASTGAESFIAGAASCRILVTDIDALYAELAPKESLHPVDGASPTHTDCGTREFAALDLDGRATDLLPANSGNALQALGVRRHCTHALRCVDRLDSNGGADVADLHRGSADTRDLTC